LTDDDVERFERDFFAFVAEGKYVSQSDFSIKRLPSISFQII
jgi:hypothetical protein